MKERTSVYYILLVSTIIYALYLFIISTSPTTPGTETGKEITQYYNLIGHFLLYFCFSYLVFITSNEYGKWRAKFTSTFTIIIVSLYGLFIEFIQYYLPYRHFSYTDIFINIIGALSFVLMAISLRKFTRLDFLEIFL